MVMIDFSLVGRTILVTGACGAIGQRVVAAILDLGGAVIATDLSGESEVLKNLAGAHGKDKLTYFQCDLEDSDAIGSLSSSVRTRFRTLEGLVHNAALVGSTDLPGWSGDFHSQSLSAWERALKINLTAPFLLTQALEAQLRAARRASVVTVSSIHALVGPDWSLYEGTELSSPAAYAASKSGLIGLTRWMAGTVGPEVRVNSVAPGGIIRNQPKRFLRAYVRKTNANRLAVEDDVVGPIIFLLTSAADYITGHTIVVDGGYTNS